MKKTKLLTVLSAGLIGGGLLVSIPLVSTSCGVKAFEINSNIASKYLIESGNDIFVGDGSSIDVGHKLLDLKKLSDDNHGITNFVVTNNVDFGFLVDPSMDCHISAKHNAIVGCETETVTQASVGVIVGKTGNWDGTYTNNLVIDKSATFLILHSGVESSGAGYGVYIDTVASDSHQIINGTFTIKGDFKNTYGVHIDNVESNATVTVSGTFSIDGDDVVCGVYIDDTGIKSLVTINGTFTVVGDSCTGVWFKNVVEGEVVINGTFTINGESGAASYGVYFNELSVSSKLTILGVFTIESTSGDVYGVFFQLQTSGAFGSCMIGASFTLYSSGNNCGVVLGQNASTGSSIEWDSNFYSSKVPYVNATAWVVTTLGTSKWNGKSFKENFVPTDEYDPLVADGTLQTKDVGDKDPDPNFIIKVLKQASTTDIEEFNSAYLEKLTSYVGDKNCPTTAKVWLQDIIDGYPW